MHLALIAAGVLDNAGDQSEQSVVRSAAYVVAGVNVSSSLTNEDVARQNELTVRALNAETL